MSDINRYIVTMDGTMSDFRYGDVVYYYEHEAVVQSLQEKIAALEQELKIAKRKNRLSQRKVNQLKYKLGENGCM